MDLSTNEQTRIQTLDVIRGFAVFGIFLVNWPSITGIETLDGTKTYVGVDAFIRLIYDLFIQTKFYTIFSFLFGLGFFIFVTNAIEKTQHPRLLFVRRLSFLFLFGALHYILLWSGDILHSYAISGIFLLLFYKRRPKTILIWAILLLTLFQLLMFLVFIFIDTSTNTVREIIGVNPLQHWTEQAANRWERFSGESIALNLLYVPETLGLFLLGLFAGKIRFFYRVKEWDRWLRRLQITALLLTLPSWYMILHYYAYTDVYNSAEIYIYILLSGKTLFIFYTVTLTRLMQNKAWQRILQPLQYTGRMAFTNYLTQTICTVILFGIFTPNSPNLPLLAGLVFCMALYSLQIFWSKWWLSRFQHGPFEYIWRLGTYGKKARHRQT